MKSNSSSSMLSKVENDFDLNNDTNAKKDHIPPVDPLVISELEEQAKIASKSLSNMMHYLSKQLSDTTDVAKKAVGVYDTTVEHVQSEVEQNIKTMYGLIAKCEELDRKMKPVTELAHQVKHIKETLDVLEQLCK